ncbi:MAG: prepilin peptidase [Rhodocyclales bacterium]|nr:prepilin peptidase [Rhodocyclales bacterium]
MSALAGLPTAVYVLGALVVGATVGSFLNVLIHRLPRMLERGWQAQAREFLGLPTEAQPRYDLARPASHCPHCGHAISAWENVPLVSWLVLRGRCRHCRAPIGWRYPLVELLGSLAALAALWRFGLTWQALAAAGFLWCAIALTFIDLETRLLPDALTLPLLWAGLLVNLQGAFVPLPDAVLGAAAGYLVLWSIYWLFKLLTGKEGMGYGDFKLLAALGAWLGWTALPLVLLLSSLAGAVIGVTLKALGRLNEGEPLPFGPFLAAGGVVALLWGREILHWWLGAPILR